jgi:hypothetical protein
MLRRADKLLKSAGVVQTRLKYEETLVAGFAFGLWWKYAPRPTVDLDRLSAFLGAIGIAFSDLNALPNDRERLNLIAERLDAERSGLQHWFKLGLWTFGNSWLLGANRFADDTEAARGLMREDDEVRKMGGNLMATLMDIGWPPDDAETFYVEKLVPFLYDPGHRRWVDNPEMAVMSDLRHKARELDAQLSGDSDSKRVTGAGRALVSELPVVGKALEILLFGAKK